MEKENISKEVCKNCGSKLTIEDSIFCGYCEKCYNKWINKKTKKTEGFNKQISISIMPALSCLCGIISIVMISIIFILIITSLPSLFINVITLFQFPELSQMLDNDIAVITKLIYTSILFETTGILLGIISIKLDGKNAASVIGIVSSIISALPICCVLAYCTLF